jgi:ubiquinone/menaquinone biosynthesis C-methylase UbiE
MNWEETIYYIRSKPEYAMLVEKAYFDPDLMLNVNRFKDDVEFKETLNLLEEFAPNSKSILDIGCGNGISTIAFALKGFELTAVEPDPSDTIGAGAIRKLVKLNNLKNVKVYEDFAENIKFDSNSFDVVYVRQAMHHAYDLQKFIGECGRVLKPGGVLLTIRDHVVFNQKDKEWFLEMHPLQKFYGGENAFSPKEYKEAMNKAGLEVAREIKYYDSPINFSPNTQAMIDEKFKELTLLRFKNLASKIGFLGKLNLVKFIYTKYLDFKNVAVLDETMVPGRMYSYVCVKK